MSNKYDISKSSDMKRFSKDLQNKTNEQMINGMFNEFKNQYPDLTSEQYDLAYKQIKDNLTKGITEFEIKV